LSVEQGLLTLTAPNVARRNAHDWLAKVAY